MPMCSAPPVVFFGDHTQLTPYSFAVQYFQNTDAIKNKAIIPRAFSDFNFRTNEKTPTRVIGALQLSALMFAHSRSVHLTTVLAQQHRCSKGLTDFIRQMVSGNMVGHGVIATPGIPLGSVHTLACYD